MRAATAATVRANANGSSWRSSSIFPWIEQSHPQMFKIPDVAGGQGARLDGGGRGDQRIERRKDSPFGLREPAKTPRRLGDRGGHVENAIAEFVLDRFDPCLKFQPPGGVGGQSDAVCEFVQCNDAQPEIAFSFQKRLDVSRRPRPDDLG